MALRSSPSLTPACLWAAVLQTFQRFPRASSSASPWRLPTSAETPCPGRGEASACPSERVSLTRGDLAGVVGEMAARRFCPAEALGLLCECSVGGTEVPCPKRAEAEGAEVALVEVKGASATLSQLPLLWGLESPKDQLPWGAPSAQLRVPLQSPPGSPCFSPQAPRRLHPAAQPGPPGLERRLLAEPAQ